MARKELAVEPREVVGKKVAQLRRKGFLPAHIYGKGLESRSVQVKTEEMERTLKVATANEVIDIKITDEGEVRPMVIHKVQRHPLNSNPLHLDFYQVSLMEKMRADVPLIVVGQSEALITFGGVLVHAIEALHIEALPLDIPTHIEVDITPLNELEMSVHVRDLPIPSNVTVLNDPDVVVVKVAAPRIAEEIEAEATAAAEAAAAEAAATPEGQAAAAAEAAAEGESASGGDSEKSE